MCCVCDSGSEEMDTQWLNTAHWAAAVCLNYAGTPMVESSRTASWEIMCAVLKYNSNGSCPAETD